MKKSWIVVVAVLFGSSVWAAPVGPGGRIYITRYGTGANDNQTQLLRIDVGADWSIVADCGVIATVVNIDDYNPGDTRYSTSPEILHPRVGGGDGSVFLAGYFDNSNHVRYYKIMPDGTQSVLHPGVGEHVNSPATYPPYTGGDSDITYGATCVIDNKGDTTGYANSIFALHGATAYYNVYWSDANGNDDLTDDCDVYNPVGHAASYAGYIYGGLARDDAEIGGPPSGYDGTDNKVWGNVYYDIKHMHYVGPRWSVSSFYTYQSADATRKYLFRNHGIAVGDVDGDGIMDVFAVTTDPQGTAHNGGTIFRMADLTGDGTAHQGDNDLWSVIYNNATLAGSSNDLGDYGRVELELIRDPDSLKWTLLVLDESGRLYAMELADNGDLASGVDAIKIVHTGLSLSGFSLYGLEFDADPAVIIPEPATLLLAGTGVLGALGWIRRRRMR